VPLKTLIVTNRLPPRKKSVNYTFDLRKVSSWTLVPAYLDSEFGINGSSTRLLIPTWRSLVRSTRPKYQSI